MSRENKNINIMDNKFNLLEDKLIDKDMLLIKGGQNFIENVDIKSNASAGTGCGCGCGCGCGAEPVEYL